MQFNFLNKLPTPLEIKQQFPVSLDLKKIKEARDREIEAIFTGTDDRFLVVIGPCSAHDRDAVLSYVDKLAALQERVKDRVLIIPRIYTNKPRTTGAGYKGLLHQPDPLREPDMLSGIKAIRRLHIDVLRETGMSTADEMLYPENHRYLNDVLGYVAVGARSVENQFHRLTASGLGIPCGMKNPTSGDFSVMINAIRAAHDKHTFIYRGWEVSTPGNPLTHAILRGYVDARGDSYPNYHYEDLNRLHKAYNASDLANACVIVDTNHANSGKRYKEQVRITKELMYSRKINPDLRAFVRGIMVESFLEEGTQKAEEGIFGKSITDPCLGWPDTEALIMHVAENV
ncbi:MAG: 3-deoxy-7-phosphoheptulonate synthase [Eubacteriales bacterium]|nr:3-deoxy-7-phosphoheptulonate synthase [Eubacteriales bacterium]